MADLADREQFETAYRRLAPLAQAVAQRVLRDKAAAEDVVQELFLALWRDPGSYDPRRGSLRGYVTMLAWSRSVDRRRALSASRFALERLAGEARVRRDETAGAADDAAARREQRRELMTVVRRLPAEQREVILLAYGRGLSTGEIAAGKGLPLGTTKSRIRLGLARARAGLSEAA